MKHSSLSSFTRILLLCCTCLKMASSAHHHLPTPYGTTAAPPPTPSTQAPNPLTSSDTADVLSRLLHRLPPTLSLPTRRSPRPTTATATASPPLISLISLSPQTPASLAALLSASSELGFFQLTNHSVPSQLARSAESDSLSLFSLPREQKQLRFPKNWPLGFDCDDDEDDSNDSFCFDSACSTESSAELNLASLGEFTREMEKVGLEVVEALSCAVGFENPARVHPTRVCSLMWVSQGSAGNEPGMSGKFYPYVVGLHYQIRCQRYSLMADSGSVLVSPQVESVLVTFGDIAQVWSNGKVKKVRGRPVPCHDENSCKNAHCISMSLLVTLQPETTVSPLLIPRVSHTSSASTTTTTIGDQENTANYEDDDGDGGGSFPADTLIEGGRAFNSFSFEDYAWRVYHERLPSKDPLDRYRI